MLRTLALLGCLGLAACSDPIYPYPPGSSEAFGDAVRHNMAAHIIDPTPADPALGMPADGRRAALKVERYRTDQVETPATTAISSQGPASVGGDGGGGEGG
jgi:hypothetical protein